MFVTKSGTTQLDSNEVNSDCIESNGQKLCLADEANGAGTLLEYTGADGAA